MEEQGQEQRSQYYIFLKYYERLKGNENNIKTELRSISIKKDAVHYRVVANDIFRKYNHHMIFYLGIWNHESEFLNGTEPIYEYFGLVAKKYKENIKCPICGTTAKMSEKREFLKQAEILYYCSNQECQCEFLVDIRNGEKSSKIGRSFFKK
ncbi:MAG TPA: hypothetical protein PLA41_01745 [Candidatus Pacearchaeota archaeon]|nr:hypothetical protein [Candidatus Pacearchaeota archaeon]HQI74358.1 hypothetical protein [Candidatus Pacearchaeota archaeon]